MHVTVSKLTTTLCSEYILYCVYNWANVTYWYGLVWFGTVINYSVNCCTTVPYRTEPYSVGSLASVGLVRYGTVRYGTVRYGTVRYGTVRYATLGNGSVNTV